MKTIRQIADELGIDKQRVYRFIRRYRITDVHRDTGVMWYDEAAETQIIEHFLKNSTSSEAHQITSGDTVIDTVITMLQRELEIKNQQIEQLNIALERTTASLQAAQALHGGTIQKQLTDGLSNQEEPKGFLTRIFRKRTKEK